jgi:hypothetical protein
MDGIVRRQDSHRSRNSFPRTCRIVDPEAGQATENRTRPLMSAPHASSADKAVLRVSLLQVIAEYRQLSDSSPFNGIAAVRRAVAAELAGALASNYLNELDGLLAAW